MSSNSADREAATADLLQKLYRTWQPHPAQATILHALYYEGVTDVFAECGRKFGKTETAGDFLRRFANQTDKHGGVYYIAPEQKQAKEILWANKRIHRMIPTELIAGINNTEMRITFKNGNFLKLDGSDNSEAGRGIEPLALVYDEYKDHDPAYHIAMNPNRAVHNAPLLVIGTPPEQEGHATELKESFLHGKNSRYFNFPIWENPHISREWIAAEKKRLFERGEEDVWYREYEAKFVRGGKNSIFPMLDAAKHRRPHTTLISEIQRDFHKLRWFCVADPGSTSVFAVLFCAYNPYTKMWYMLDEIYEKDQRETSVTKILPRIKAAIENLCPTAEWSFIYDEAAAWFLTEATAGSVPDVPLYPWSPTNKIAMKRDPLTKEPWGISLMKDMLRFDKILISEKCKWLWWEMSNYTRTLNKAGDIKVLKRGDHLIDDVRYALEYVGFTLQNCQEPGIIQTDRRKVFTIEEDLRNDRWMLGW